MRQFRKRELEEIIKKHFPECHVIYYYTEGQWKIIKSKKSIYKIIHRVPLPENWQNITEEEFDALIVLSML